MNTILFIIAIVLFVCLPIVYFLMLYYTKRQYPLLLISALLFATSTLFNTYNAFDMQAMFFGIGIGINLRSAQIYFQNQKKTNK
jgi:hypothetical protein